MAYKLTLARVAEKGAIAFKVGALLGQNGKAPGAPGSLYQEGDRVSLIGAALPTRLRAWLEAEGLSSCNLEGLYQCGHIDAAPQELAALYALEALDAARRDHWRRGTGHGPALDLALAAFTLASEGTAAARQEVAA